VTSCSRRSHYDIAKCVLEVDQISVSVSAPNVDKWALSADIRFRPKAVVPHSVHFRFGVLQLVNSVVAESSVHYRA